MRIRSAEQNDFDQLVHLLRQLNPDDRESQDLQKLAFEEILASKYLDLIIAEENSVILACCYLNILPNMTRGGRPYAVIENVVTDSKQRNRGFGKSIVSKAVERAWEADCYKVMLMSGRTDPAVHAFYVKCGFSPDEKQAFVQRAH